MERLKTSDLNQLLQFSQGLVALFNGSAAVVVTRDRRVTYLSPRAEAWMASISVAFTATHCRNESIRGCDIWPLP